MSYPDKSPSSFWKPINWGWKYWNYMIIGIGLVVGFCVWALPNKWADPEYKAKLAQQSELARQIKAYNAEQARIAKENEELGLVYIDPGTNPFLPPEGAPEAEDGKKDGK